MQSLGTLKGTGLGCYERSLGHNSFEFKVGYLAKDVPNRMPSLILKDHPHVVLMLEFQPTFLFSSFYALIYTYMGPLRENKRLKHSLWSLGLQILGPHYGKQ